MTFNTPSIEDLANRAARAFRADLAGSDAALWPNNVAVSAKVIAGAVWEAFAFIDYVSRQINKSTAESPFLERHAADYGLTRLPASYASGEIVLSGDSGATVPAGVVVVRADGIRYETTAAGTVSGLGTLTLPVRALDPGRIGNAAAGVVVTLVAPLSRIVSAGEVAASGIGAGADAESLESLRARLLFRLRNPPHGGAAHDYVAWMREINGVTRVFVDPVTESNGRSDVGIWFLMDDTYINGIPQASDVTAARTYIDARRPAGALVSIAAPVAVTIASLIPDTTAVRERIAIELSDLMRRARVATLTNPYTLYRSQISEAISIAIGETGHTLTAPVSDVVLAAGQIPVLGAVVFA
jgi:uncharacterized phage protein gp47/JayE